MEEDKDLN